MFLPESIDLGQSEKYVLSIRIKSNGFMFSISDPEVKSNYCLRETTFSIKDSLLSNIQRIVFDLNFLTQEFKQTNVIVVSTDYDLMPAEYFNASEKESIYDFTHSYKSGHLLSGLIEKQDIVTLFNLDKEIYDFCLRSLWNPYFLHHSNLLINLFENKNRVQDSSSKMYLNFHDNFLDIMCFSGTKLVHSLSYENEPVPNQIYFILKVWEKCGFDQLKDFIYITGKPSKLVLGTLQEYIKNVEQQNTPSEIYLWHEDALKAPLDLLALSL